MKEVQFKTLSYCCFFDQKRICPIHIWSFRDVRFKSSSFSTRFFLCVFLLQSRHENTAGRWVLFLSFFLGWQIPNLITGLIISGWCATYSVKHVGRGPGFFRVLLCFVQPILGNRFFLSFFLVWRIPNLTTGLSGW